MPGKSSNMLRTRVFVWLIGILLVSGTAWAQGEPAKSTNETTGDEPAQPGDFEGAEHMMEPGALGEGEGGERLWAQGVPPEEQEAARVLFQEGNDLLRESLFPQAVKKYREALQHWDHPGIHFNLSLALLNLDQPIAVYRSLQKAMQYGEAPLDKEKLERAQRYFDLVSDQLGTVEIVCNEPQAKVTLNGKPVLTGPGSFKELLIVGEHQVVASKPGFVDETRNFVIEPREQERIDIVLYSVADLTISRRRWSAWKPWALVGAGAVFLAVGGGLHSLSADNFKSFDAEFNARCQQNTGCFIDQIPELQNQLRTAERQQQLAVASYAVGGAALATGVVLVYFNRARLFRRDIRNGTEVEVSWTPIFEPGVTGLRAGFHF